MRGDLRDRGSATVEFALVLPILLIVALGLVQVAILGRDQLTLAAAARAGAREAAVTADLGSIQAAVHRTTRGLPDGGPDVSVTRGGSLGDPVTVSLSYSAPIRAPVLAWLFPSTIVLHADAVMRQEFG